MKVLIAEDDTPSRMLLERKLDSWGYEVLAAERGDQAWDLIRTEKPGIVILDWVMPGLNGIDVSRKIRSSEDLPYIYIILLTSKRQSPDMLTGFNAGADDYIIKPFDKDILRSRVAVGQRVVDPYLMTLDPNTPPGVYNLEVGLYLSATLERLRLITSDGTLSQDRLLLTKVRVLPK